MIQKFSGSLAKPLGSSIKVAGHSASDRFFLLRGKEADIRASKSVGARRVGTAHFFNCENNPGHRRDAAQRGPIHEQTMQSSGW
ncbi:hypothetical protein [Brucella pituitosa]|uniref:hypothetical protein n=1 Tax=Brucella pituitosa TaxID=571256 RepID=UPI00126024FA|nr:hypothetical protein [Brucella pituitosa]